MPQLEVTRRSHARFVREELDSTGIVSVEWYAAHARVGGADLVEQHLAAASDDHFVATLIRRVLPVSCMDLFSCRKRVVRLNEDCGLQ